MEYSSPEEVDVVIVGAGVSGLVLARQLAYSDLAVVVLEQRYSIPRNRRFAGLVSRDDIRTFAVEPPDPIPVCEIVSIDVDAGWHSDARSYPDGALFAVTHDELLGALGQGCRERNVPVLPDRTVTELLWKSGMVSGVRVGPGREEIQSRLVVLADESDPRLAETPGLRPDWPPTRLMHVGKECFDAAPDEIARRFGTASGGFRSLYLGWTTGWGDPVEAYVAPAKDSVTAGVNYLLEDEMVSTRHVLEVLAELREFPRIAPLLSGLGAPETVTEVVPIGRGAGSPRLASDGILVVSDVVGATNPLNRDGLSGNLELCTAAAAVIREALAAGDLSASGLAPYGAFLRRYVHDSGKAGLRRQPPSLMEDAAHPLLRKSGSVTASRKSATLSGRVRPIARAFNRLRRAGEQRPSS